jgi:hypothetical protein
VPLISDEIEQDVEVEVQVKSPGVAVAVYLVPTASPLPFSQETSRALSAEVATSFVTASGMREKILTRLVPVLVPVVFTPTTLIVYSVPTVRLVIEHLVEVDVHCDPPGIAEAVYVIPVVSPTACSHETSNALSTTLAANLVTGKGERTNFIVSDEDVPVPSEFTPTTVIVYSVPSVRPLMEHVVDVDVHDAPPGVAVAVYVTPSSSPAPFTHDTSSSFLLTTAERPVTALGRPGVEDTTTPLPIALRAYTNAE